MIWIGAGTLALFFLLLALHRLAHASRADLGRALVMVCVVLLAIIGFLLLITGRLFMALPLLFTALAGIFRFGSLARLLSARRSWQARQQDAGSTGGGRQENGPFSSVETAWLSMRLYHESGAVDGTVLKGAFKGASLRSMARADLVALLRLLQEEDPESARLLEAYINRDYGSDWRETEEGEEEGKDVPPQSAAMDKKEARKILAVAEDADEAEIRAAHRRLMKKIHPDRGGSAYLAARINEAKDILLGP